MNDYYWRAIDVYERVTLWRHDWDQFRDQLCGAQQNSYRYSL